MDKFEKCCEDNQIPFKRPILNNATRWNSTFSMLQRALEYQSALDDYVYQSRKKPQSQKGKGKEVAQTGRKKRSRNLTAKKEELLNRVAPQKNLVRIKLFSCLVWFWNLHSPHPQTANYYQK